MRCMGRDDPSGHISYGEFRNFLVLLPPERLSVDPQAAWFESATMVQLAPPVVAKRGQVLKSAIAGRHLLVVAFPKSGSRRNFNVHRCR